MFEREVAVAWICALVVLSTITLTGGVGIGISAAATNAEFQVVDADLEDDTIVEGDTATITATIENVGNESGTFTAELETDADGVVDSTDVTIEAGEMGTVEFTRAFETAGSYQLSVSGEPAGTLTVTEPAAAEFTVTDVTLSDTDIEVGDSIDVSADVENTGDADGTYAADLLVDDEVRDTTSVDVAAGDTETVSFTPTFETVGDYAVGVGDGPTQELTVTELDPATLSVTDATLEETTVVEGDLVTVTADVENTGDREGSLSVAIEADGTVRTTDEVTVGANDDETEEFSFTAADAGEYDITANDVAAGTLTVTEPATAEFTVTDVALSDDEIEVGDSIDVSADVENTGDADGTYAADLVVDGEVRDSETVDVDAGDTETVSFTTTFETAGDYAVGVDDASPQDLEVDPEPADISITDASLSETDIDPADAVTVTATAVNEGGSSGEVTADLRVDGATRDTKSRTLDPGAEATIEFTPTFDEAGTYDIAVNDETAGTLDVAEPATFEVSNARVEDDTILAGDTAVVSAEVTNVGDSEGTFTAEASATARDGTGVRIDSRSVTLAGGNSETIELRGAVEQAGEYDVAVEETAAGTLTVDEPADPTVTDATLEETTVVEDGQVTVTATVENTGGREGSLSVAVAADETVEATGEVTVPAGAQRTEEFTFTAADAGEYDITVNDETAGTLTVTEPAAAEFAVTDVTLSDDEIEVGGSVDVTAEIENTGDADGTYAADLVVDGEVRDSKTVDVAAGDTETVTFTRTFDSADDYTLGVGNASPQELKVSPEPADISITEASFSEADIDPGDTVTVTATAVNDGGSSGEITADLQVNGVTRNTETRTLDPGAEAEIEFTTTFDEAGTYDVAVNDEPAGTLRVLEPADVSIRETSLTPETITTGESAAITVELANDGDVDGEFTARLGDGSETLDSVTRTVGPNGNETVRFERTFQSAGEYELAVNDEAVGTLAVLEPADVSLGESSLASETVERNESIELTVALRNDGEATGEQGISISLGDGTDIQRTASVPDNGTMVTVTHAYTATGNYTVAVDGATVGTVDVVEPSEDTRSGGGGGGGSSGSADPSGSSGDSGSSGTGGSSGSTGGSGGASTTDPEPTVARSVSEEAVAVDISGAEGERFEAAVELAGPSTSEPAVSLRSFAVNPAGEQDAFGARVGRPTAEPDGLDPVPYGVPLGYVSFNTTLDGSETSAATLQFSVDETSIPNGLGPEDVAVMRYTDDGWTTANVTLEGSADGQRVTLPRASPVAVVALEPGSVDTVETVGPADRVRAGYETTLRVRVDNPGDRPANRTLTVEMNGESVAEREVTLGPEQNATVPISFEPSESGTVSLDGSDVGEITLFEGANGSASTNDDETDEETPGFGVVVALLALVITAVAARIRR